MQETDRGIDALAYALGWLVLIAWGWLTAVWVVYLGWIAGSLGFVPDAWWPSPELYWIFIGVGKLMVVGLAMAWIAVLLYRRRLRRA